MNIRSTTIEPQFSFFKTRIRLTDPFKQIYTSLTAKYYLHDKPKNASLQNYEQKLIENYILVQNVSIKNFSS